MDDVELGWLLRSYYRRKQFETDLLANTVVAALAKAWGVGEQASPTPHPAGHPSQPGAAQRDGAAYPERQVVPAYEFFKILES